MPHSISCLCPPCREERRLLMDETHLHSEPDKLLSLFETHARWTKILKQRLANYIAELDDTVRERLIDEKIIYIDDPSIRDIEVLKSYLHQ